MDRNGMTAAVVLALLLPVGCAREQRGPLLAGGREVRTWLTALHDPKPQARRQAVLKLGNVGDADPAAAEGLAEALYDTDAVVRRDAILAVAKMSKPGPTILAQLKAMRESDRDPVVRDHAGKALTHFRAEE